ncbi:MULTISPECIES: energy-coupling factor ABC transporter ATP-binding protein [Pontibacillus]|uniref:Energy-coupling factor transporter ATP-binding protein EcfA2 n=1 Tax=Pontibacillus chungwhensis TaxID=265426 RepID=A0ABY8UY42_9BACI|nr:MULTISPECIES: energy-coupling factor ABC transporter ATP-binding protein [Pontibacillus]MCD5326010.1 energy-coupling factor ABC transporter ATP-binding protein [Pontibacillus sp. HN14]WIF98285.1 energy-coupling factor ABC transporter ATP-binding protein [Pontibacillus chungwhensis]
MDITFNNVSYIYQPNSPFEHRALENLSFEISSGSFVAVIGHTGSGKSTLIQHLNGLLAPTHGSVTVGDVTLQAGSKPKNLKALRKQVGVVFQYPEHQLFEETIEKDISFGPANFGVSKEEIEQRVQETIGAVGLSSDMLERSPFDLSGGQMRRVAIAGVLAMNPRVLVLDEPTAGLDPKGQREIMDMFYQLHHEKELTTVHVTHSMEDALAYADYVIVMHKGQLYMQGKPLEVFKEKDALNNVGLDVPEIIELTDKMNKRFGLSIEYKNQTIKELAEEVAQHLKGASQ